MENENKPKVLLLFSGGFDSTVLLHDLMRQGNDVTLLFIEYNQRALKQEWEHTTYWIEKYGLECKKVKMNPFNWSKSATIEGGDEHDNEDNDYLELRNLIFFSYASSIAQSLKIPCISSAILWNTFDDTTPNFCKGFDALLFNTAGIELYTPYCFLNKQGLANLSNDKGFDLKEILEHSISCNVPVDGEPCGECQECKSISAIKNSL